MPEKVKILSARRAYEFGRDDLRLTMLSSPEIRQRIQQEFGFEVAQVGSPAPTFGPVPSSLPPGLIFDVGTVRFPNGVSMPIRFLHFEPHRIVVDGVGPSFGIDLVFERIREIASELATPDGSLMIDEPSQITEYSEISAHLNFGFDALADKALLERVQALFEDEQVAKRIQPVSVSFQIVDDEDTNVSFGYTLEIRGGTRLQDRMYFSAGNVRTDQHLAWLEKLEKKLAPLAP